MLSRCIKTIPRQPLDWISPGGRLEKRRTADTRKHLRKIFIVMEANYKGARNMALDERGMAGLPRVTTHKNI